MIDHWWQTETGWAIAGNPLGLGLLPVKPGSPTVPVPGYDVRVLDEGGKQCRANTMGAIAIKLPLPPGACPRCGRDDERFRDSYLAEFPGYYKTADAGYIDEDGYLFIMGRTDDVINVAGHRLSTGGMEEVLAGHPDVAECAVIGVKDALKGEVPCGFVVLKAGVDAAPAEIEERDRRARPRADRPGGRLQARDHRPAPAEDALGQDPARHHAEDRRRRGLDDAGDHRRPGDPRRDRGGAEGEGRRGGGLRSLPAPARAPVIPEAAARGYPGSMSAPGRREAVVPALAALGRDDSARDLTRTLRSRDTPTRWCGCRQPPSTARSRRSPTDAARAHHPAERRGRRRQRLARPFMSLPAIMKHLDVLTDAALISRTKTGRTVICRLTAAPMEQAMGWLRRYERFWSEQLDRLAAYVEEESCRANSPQQA